MVALPRIRGTTLQWEGDWDCPTWGNSFQSRQCRLSLLPIALKVYFQKSKPPLVSISSGYRRPAVPVCDWFQAAGVCAPDVLGAGLDASDCRSCDPPPLLPPAPPLPPSPPGEALVDTSVPELGAARSSHSSQIPWDTVLRASQEVSSLNYIFVCVVGENISTTVVSLLYMVATDWVFREKIGNGWILRTNKNLEFIYILCVTGKNPIYLSMVPKESHSYSH